MADLTYTDAHRMQRVKWTSPPAVSAADLVCLIAGVETRREASVVVSELKDRLLLSNAVAYCTIKVSTCLPSVAPSVLYHINLTRSSLAGGAVVSPLRCSLALQLTGRLRVLAGLGTPHVTPPRDRVSRSPFSASRATPSMSSSPCCPRTTWSPTRPLPGSKRATASRG